MMKKTVMLVTIMVSTLMFGQDLPINPEPGKCYIRCSSPDVYVNQDHTVTIKPSYTRLKVVPATYKKVTERVEVRPERKKYSIAPEKWGTEKVTYASKEGGITIKVHSANFRSSNLSVEVKPAYAQWELGASAPDCASGNPDDCRYWCYKGYPAEFTTLETQVLGNPASSTKTPVANINGTYIRHVLLEPAKVIEGVIPAQYEIITKTVIDKEAHTIEETIPAVTKTITREVLKEKGGLNTWKEVECSLVEYQALPINWNLGSASLTTEAKRLIDQRLMPVLRQNPGIKLEIASHTDVRGSLSSNQDLSERRAKSVADYLISRGINSSLLVANGYGETKVKNRCGEGVSCTEREHAVNRRTEFRLINN